MFPKNTNDLRCCWNLRGWLQNSNPVIPGAPQELIDGRPRGPGMQLPLQPLYNPCQHLNIGIGAVRV